MNLHDIPAINDGLNHLLKSDPVFARVFDGRAPEFFWPYMGGGLESLIRIIFGQQVSTKAAQALWLKYLEQQPQSENELKACGISRQKRATIIALRQAVENGTLNFAVLDQRDDEYIYETLTAFKGIGRWSAQMYLIFGLARPDIWPAADLGICEGLRRYHGMNERPSAKEAEDRGAGFVPHRTAAALLLWALKS